MARRKTMMTIYLTEEQHDSLKRLSASTRVPVSVYVREGLDLVLGQYRDQIPPAPPEEDR